MSDDTPTQIEMFDEPVFTPERVFDYIRTILAGVGIVATIIAIGFWSAK